MFGQETLVLYSIAEISEIIDTSFAIIEKRVGVVKFNLLVALLI